MDTHIRYNDPERAEIRAEELARVIEDRPGQLFKLITAACFVLVAVRAWLGRTISRISITDVTVSSVAVARITVATSMVTAMATMATAILALNTTRPRPIIPQVSASAAEKVIFNDTFCTSLGGWTTGGGLAGGHYSSCALRIYANANDVESSEPRDAAVYPATPARLKIDVTARQITGSAEGDEFGIACRAGGEGYAFIVQSELAEIIRYSSITGIIGSPLAEAPAKVDMNVRNRLKAICSNSGSGVYLALWVNGQKLADFSDTNNPILNGTVGLFAATTPSTQTSIEAEFKNFRVIKL